MSIITWTSACFACIWDKFHNTHIQLFTMYNFVSLMILALPGTEAPTLPYHKVFYDVCVAVRPELNSTPASLSRQMYSIRQQLQRQACHGFHVAGRDVSFHTASGIYCECFFLLRVPCKAGQRNALRTFNAEGSPAPSSQPYIPRRKLIFRKKLFSSLCRGISFNEKSAGAPTSL